MTAIPRRITDRLDEIEAGPVLIAIGLFLTTFIGALIIGSQLAIELVLAVAFVWLAWNWGLLHSRVDEALDDADKAHGRVQAVENHLTGIEAPSTGKHGGKA